MDLGFSFVAVLATGLSLLLAFYILFKQRNSVTSQPIKKMRARRENSVESRVKEVRFHKEKREEPATLDEETISGASYKGIRLDGVKKSELKFGKEPDMLVAEKYLTSLMDMEEEKRQETTI